MTKGPDIHKVIARCYLCGELLSNDRASIRESNGLVSRYAHLDCLEKDMKKESG